MIEFNIPDMNCGGCGKSVAAVCASVDSNARVELDLSRKMARIDSAVPADIFAAALTQAGFPPG